MEKVIVEVGSTNTKFDLYDGEKVIHLSTETIEFKKTYKKENKIDSNDFNKLVKVINEYKLKYNNIYVCGTSIFRNLTKEQKSEFLSSFKEKTEIDFEIISIEKENELTVAGVVKNINQKVAILISGGGSTVIAIYDNGIKEMVNTPYGVMDVMNQFPDLGKDVADTELESVREVIKEKLNLPKEKADVLILAGGGHKKFALNSGVSYEKNIIFDDELQPIMMDIETRKNDTLKYFKQISLDEIKSRESNPNWWYATRAMCAVVLNVADAVNAKYIIPTDVSMVYGLLENEL